MMTFIIFIYFVDPVGLARCQVLLYMHGFFNTLIKVC